MVSAMKALLTLTLTVLVVRSVSGEKEDTKIAANIAAGEKVLKDYQELLNGMKASPAAQKTLEDSVKDLNIKAKAKGKGRTGSVTSCARACCKVDLKQPPVTKAVRKTKPCHQYFTEYYKAKCGFGGWKRCGRSRSADRIGTCPYVVYEHVTLPPRSCPTGKDTCCSGALFFDGCCIGISQFEAIINRYRSMFASLGKLG